MTSKAEAQARWQRTPHGRAQIAAYRKRRYEEHKAITQTIKLASGCVDCPDGTEWPAECLDFDHLGNDKVAAIATMYGWSRKLIEAEVAKCEVVCANHHRIRTGIRRNAN